MGKPVIYVNTFLVLHIVFQAKLNHFAIQLNLVFDTHVNDSVEVFPCNYFKIAKTIFARLLEVRYKNLYFPIPFHADILGGLVIASK